MPDDYANQLEIVQEMNKELECIIEAVGDGIVVSDGRGYVIRVNKAYTQMVGITAEEYIGKHVRDLLKEGYIGRTTSDIVIERKSVLHVTDIRNSREMLLTSIPVLNEAGDVIRVVTVFRDLEELNALRKQISEMEQLRLKNQEELKSKQVFRSIVTKSQLMKEKIELAFHVARVNSTVLIQGESGTGKELFAQLIHRASPRSGKPFIKLNCGALPETLLEAELFGYERGAFTGANKDGKMGLFEVANGGTLFLDEISELPLSLQVKLLRAIQEKEIRRVGGKNTLVLDVRFVAATNQHLDDMVKKKSFREDLYHRLNVIPILLPPLRERRDDIFPIASEFLDRINKQYGLQKWLDLDLMKFLTFSYHWPGNVRELHNIIERLAVTCQKDCISLEYAKKLFPAALEQQGDDGSQEMKRLKTTVESEEKRLLKDAYETAGSTRKAAILLGISQSSVVKKLKKYGINQ